jgi:long-chain acyl-CoA synthetase
MPATTLNLASLLVHQARLTPDRPAVVMRPHVLSYAALDARSNQIAHGLRALGVRPGDRVALSCPNTPHFPPAYFGILKAGGVVVPLNVLLKAREIAYHLRDADDGTRGV